MSSTSIPAGPDPSTGLTATGRYLVIIAAFLGWFFGGTHMAINGLAMRTAALNLLAESSEGDLNEDDRTQITSLSVKLDLDKDGVIQTTAFDNPQVQDDLNPGQISRKELQQVGLTKNPDVVKVLGIAGDQDGVISDAELERYVIDDRLGPLAGRWFGYYVCAFLFGAALGGLVFGRIGDRFGRVKGMAAAITCYSVMSLLAYFLAQSPGQLLVARFITCMGVGGMWPNGVALMSEAWEGVSRPMLAGVIGTAANVGIFLTFWLGRQVEVDYDSWRWVLLVGGSPIVLAVFVIALVPESPKWLADRRRFLTADEPLLDLEQPVIKTSTWEVFRPGLLGVTLVGILLATVPLLGGWGASNWAQPWADKVGAEIGNPSLKAEIGMARSLTGIVGSFLGGIIASIVGRKKTYFLTSLCCLACAEYVYFFHTPDQWQFLAGFAALGFFSGIFFGWLPLFLPELFVTRMRSTGGGVCFNFGRILTAFTVFAGSILIARFNEDYALLGRIMSLIYLVGAIGICLMPAGVGGEIED